MSGNGNHGVQSATGKQPVVSTTLLNNQPLIEFDGVDDYFNSLTLTPRTIVFVSKVRPNSSYQNIIDNQSRNPMIWVRNNNVWEINTSAGIVGGITLGDWQIVAVQYDSNEHRLDGQWGVGWYRYNIINGGA